jgi:hypothetical protein
MMVYVQTNQYCVNLKLFYEGTEREGEFLYPRQEEDKFEIKIKFTEKVFCNFSNNIIGNF